MIGVDTWPTDRIARFQAKVGAADANGCLPWRGARQGRGYGSFGHGPRPGRTYLAHRVAYELEHGPIPDDLTIDHRCGNKACVNTEHMELVTRQENSRRGPGRHRVRVFPFISAPAEKRGA